MLPGVGACAQARVLHLLTNVSCPAAEPRNAVDHVNDEMEPVEVVEHHHVERGRRGAFLFVAAHVEIVVISAAIGEAVNQPRVAVVGEDDRTVGREQRVELMVGEPVRVLALRLETHQVDDVDDPDPEVGQMVAKKRGSSERLESRNVAAAAQHDVGVLVTVA